jgi:hypothetical protein
MRALRGRREHSIRLVVRITTLQRQSLPLDQDYPALMDANPRSSSSHARTFMVPSCPLLIASTGQVTHHFVYEHEEGLGTETLERCFGSPSLMFHLHCSIPRVPELPIEHGQSGNRGGVSALPPRAGSKPRRIQRETLQWSSRCPRHLLACVVFPTYSPLVHHVAVGSFVLLRCLLLGVQ